MGLLEGLKLYHITYFSLFTLGYPLSLSLYIYIPDTTHGTAIGLPISWGGLGGQCRHIWHTWSVWVYIYTYIYVRNQPTKA